MPPGMLPQHVLAGLDGDTKLCVVRKGRSREMKLSVAARFGRKCEGGCGSCQQCTEAADWRLLTFSIHSDPRQYSMDLLLKWNLKNKCC